MIGCSAEFDYLVIANDWRTETQSASLCQLFMKAMVKMVASKLAIITVVIVTAVTDKLFVARNLLIIVMQPITRRLQAAVTAIVDILIVGILATGSWVSKSAKM